MYSFGCHPYCINQFDDDDQQQGKDTQSGGQDSRIQRNSHCTGQLVGEHHTKGIGSHEPKHRTQAEAGRPGDNYPDDPLTFI